MCRWLCYPTTWWILNGYLEVRLWQTCFLSVLHFEESPCNGLLPHFCCDLHCHSITSLYLQQPSRMISSFETLVYISLCRHLWFRNSTFCNMYSRLKIVYSLSSPKNCPFCGRHPWWKWRFTWAPPGTFSHASGHCEKKFIQTLIIHNSCVFKPV